MAFRTFGGGGGYGTPPPRPQIQLKAAKSGESFTVTKYQANKQGMCDNNIRLAFQIGANLLFDSKRGSLVTGNR